MTFLKGESKDSDLIKELIIPHRRSLSENKNKHCIVLKNTCGNTEVKEGSRRSG